MGTPSGRSRSGAPPESRKSVVAFIAFGWVLACGFIVSVMFMMLSSTPNVHSGTFFLVFGLPLVMHLLNLVWLLVAWGDRAAVSSWAKDEIGVFKVTSAVVVVLNATPYLVALLASLVAMVG